MKNKLWVEKYRPNTVADYVFVDERQKKQVEGWVRDGSIPHLLLSGDPGTGKTTLAKVLIHELGVEEYDVLEINADGTRDLNFVCPITSWINICSTIYHDWENNKLYYAYQNGNSTTQTIVSCDPNTGQTLQTLTIPGSNGLVSKIAKIPNSNDLIVGGSVSFAHNGHDYISLFKLTEQFTIAPLEGITDLPCSFVVADLLFVNDMDCAGNENGSIKAYIAGSGSQMAGVDGLRGIARFTLNNGVWSIDANYNAGCSGSISDIAYYNCHLIATGNFASSMPTGLYAPSWTPKVTAFTSEGQLSPEFQMQNIGYGLGGVYTAGLENNIGQGSGRCLAVNPNDDGNDRWEIFVGGAFVNFLTPLLPDIRSPSFVL